MICSQRAKGWKGILGRKNRLPETDWVSFTDGHVAATYKELKNKRAKQGRGLLAGGNWIVNQVKMIDVYPQPEQLANIEGTITGDRRRSLQRFDESG